MFDDVDFVHKKVRSDGVVYFVPISNKRFFIYKPAISELESLQIGTLQVDDTFDLGDPIPVDFGSYRSELEDAYKKYAKIDARYNTWVVDLKDSERDVLAEICLLINDIVAPIHTHMGHA